MLNYILSAIYGGLIILYLKSEGLSKDTIYICYCMSFLLSLIYFEIKDFKKNK